MSENRLRKMRKEKGLTLKGLSQELKKKGIQLSASSLIKYERGEREPRLETWLKLSDFYNVSVDYLSGKSDLREKSDVTSIVDELRPLVKKSDKETHSEFLKSVDDVVTNKHSLVDETVMLVVMQSLKNMDGLLSKGHSQSLQASMLNIFMTIRDILSELNCFSTVDPTSVKQLHAATNQFINSLDKKESKNDREHLIEAIAGLFENGIIPGYKEGQFGDDQANKKG